MARRHAKDLKITGPQIMVGAKTYGGAETSITVNGIGAVSTEASQEISKLAMVMHQRFTDMAFSILNGTSIEDDDDYPDDQGDSNAGLVDTDTE